MALMSITVPLTEHCVHFSSKEAAALAMLAHSPMKWFRELPVDKRYLNLIRAEHVPWLNYTEWKLISEDGMWSIISRPWLVL